MISGTPEVTASALRPWCRRDVCAALACVVLGLVLAVSPHLANWARHGHLDFVADNDDLFYLLLAKDAYYGGSTLRDPFVGRWEHVPDLHSWYQFVPWARLVRWTGAPLVYLGMLWRVVGGCMLGAAFYALFRRLFASMAHPVPWALGCTLVCLSDAGLMVGRPLFDDMNLARHMLRGTTPLSKPDALSQYRVVTPLLNLPFLVLVVTVLVPGGLRRRGDALVGAVSLGACVLLYFYFWTALAATLFVYGTIMLAWGWFEPSCRAARWSQARLSGLILVGGLVLGAPQIYSNSRTFSDPEFKPLLQRAGRGVVVPPGDPVRSMYLPNRVLWVKLALGAVGVFVLRVPGLLFAWGLTLAGYVLANSALVTGLEFENGHWNIVSSSMSEVVLLVTVCVLVARMHGSAGRLGRVALALVPLPLVALALAWRPYEALRATEAVTSTRALNELRALRGALGQLDVDTALAGPTPTNGIAQLSAPCGLLYNDPYTPVTLIPLVDAHRRHALNSWLQGMDLPTYEVTARPSRPVGVVYVPPEGLPEAVRRDRVAIFRQWVDHPEEAEALVDHYRASCLLLPATAPEPTRAGPWTLVGRSSPWALWTRAGTPRATYAAPQDPAAQPKGQ